MSRRRGNPDTEGVKDLWTKITEEKEKAKAAAAAPPAAAAAGAGTGEGEDAAAAEVKPKMVAAAGLETFLLFVGSKQSGKTSLIQQFLNRTSTEEKPKPTVALEYTFGRRSNHTSNVKDIAHIWELGGGTHLKELVIVPITPQRLPNAVVVITLDLSKPESVLSNAMTWLQLVEARVRECITKIKRGDASKVEKLYLRAQQRCGMTSEHPDAKRVDPSVVPIVIVGAKYDAFMDIESVRRKPLMLALRFIAHHYGASLICTSYKEKSQLAYFRNILNHFVFHTPAKKTAHLDPAKALIVPAGADTFDGIGNPPNTRPAQLSGANFPQAVSLWQRAVEACFPPKDDAADDKKDPEADAELWLEPAVDAMRAQKKEELDRYIKEAKQKLRLEAAAASGRAGKKPRGGRKERRREGRGAGAGAGAGSGEGSDRRERRRRRG